MKLGGVNKNYKLFIKTPLKNRGYICKKLFLHFQIINFKAKIYVNP